MICFKSHTMRETEMSHTVRDKKMLLTRLKKIQGQSAALEKMLNSDHECADVLQQLAAIRGAVNGMMMQVIEGHLTDHVVKEPEEAQREADLGVVLQVIKSYLSRMCFEVIFRPKNKVRFRQRLAVVPTLPILHAVTT